MNESMERSETILLESAMIGLIRCVIFMYLFCF